MMVIFDRDRTFQESIRKLRALRDSGVSDEGYNLLTGAIAHLLANWNMHVLLGTPEVVREP